MRQPLPYVLPTALVVALWAACARESYEVRIVNQEPTAPASAEAGGAPRTSAVETTPRRGEPGESRGPAASAPRTTLSNEELARTLRDVESRAFVHQRLDAIRTIAERHRVTTAQAIALASTVPFSSLRVEALSALYPSVTDPDVFDDAYVVLDWPEDRRALRTRLLALGHRSVLIP